jgi:diketogulonate reductase-like aldo/keto reductase
MATPRFDPRRRRLLAAGLAAMTPGHAPRAAAAPLPTRPIPSSGERVPIVGLGTWQAFDVARGTPAGDEAAAGLAAFAAGGGRLIDTSPMYGRAEAALGALIEAQGLRSSLFLATKIWTRGAEAGLAQLADSHRLLRAPVLDLVQVHNLLGAATHLATLRRAREQGSVRHVGLTHWNAGAHAELERWLAREPIDVLQVNYSLLEPEADARLLDAAAARGVAVLVNRPFAEGAVLARVAGRPLPAWAIERGVASWAQYALKWVLAHPAVTVALAGTRKPRHVADNLDAARGWLPDAGERERMQREFAAG